MDETGKVDPLGKIQIQETRHAANRRSETTSPEGKRWITGGSGDGGGGRRGAGFVVARHHGSSGRQLRIQKYILGEYKSDRLEYLY